MMHAWIRFTHEDELLDHDPLKIMVGDSIEIEVEQTLKRGEIKGLTFPFTVDGMILENADGKPVAKRTFPYPVEIDENIELVFSFKMLKTQIE